MDSVDGSKSSLGASDNIYDIVCGPCKTDNVSKEAKLYCEQCQEHLCDICQDVHRKLKVTKSHNILSGRYLPKVLKGIKTYNIKQNNERLDAWISGCSFMPSGDLVLCDFYNSKLKLLNRTFKEKDRLNLNASPWSVSVIDDSNVIVTLPRSKQLQFVQLVPHMKAGRVIQFDKKCWGVAVADNEIYVSCHNAPGHGEIRVLDLSGNLKRQFGINTDGSYQFQSPNYLTASTIGKKIFVSDWLTSIITCMTLDGNNVYQYKDGDLRNPQALFVDAGDIFVCGFFSHNVQVITPDGKKDGTLIPSNGGILSPYSIAFREADNTVVIGCWLSNSIFCYKLSQ